MDFTWVEVISEASTRDWGGAMRNRPAGWGVRKTLRVVASRTDALSAASASVWSGSRFIVDAQSPNWRSRSTRQTFPGAISARPIARFVATTVLPLPPLADSTVNHPVGRQARCLRGPGCPQPGRRARQTFDGFAQPLLGRVRRHDLTNAGVHGAHQKLGCGRSNHEATDLGMLTIEGAGPLDRHVGGDSGTDDDYVGDRVVAGSDDLDRLSRCPPGVPPVVQRLRARDDALEVLGELLAG